MAKASKVRRPATAETSGDWPPKEPPFFPIHSVSGADLQAAADKREASVRRPVADGGEVNLAGTGIEDAAGKYVDLLNEQAELEEKADKLKKRLAVYADHILEQMGANAVQSVNIKGKTLYRQEDTIVSKGKGISTEEIIAVLKSLEWGELVGEAYSAQTLKATVKEGLDRAKENKSPGNQFYCPKCSRFAAPPLKAGTVCGHCSTKAEPVVLLEVIDGVPAMLHPLLYIETKWKLGARTSG